MLNECMLLLKLFLKISNLAQKAYYLFNPFDQLRKLTYLFYILTTYILDKLCIFDSNRVHINFIITCLLSDLINTLSLINIK